MLKLSSAWDMHGAFYVCRYEQGETAVRFGCFQGKLTITSKDGIAPFFSVSVGSFEQDLPITAAASMP